MGINLIFRVEKPDICVRETPIKGILTILRRKKRISPLGLLLPNSPWFRVRGITEAIML
jgi:hypothetical protein